MWAAGDLGVCVNASDYDGLGPFGYLLKEGRVYRILQVSGPHIWTDKSWSYGLLIDGPVNWGAGAVAGIWHESRFRKIQKCDAEFLEQMKEIKPPVKRKEREKV